MNFSQALPAQFIRPSFDTIQQATRNEDINLTDPKFLFESWKVYFYTKNKGNDLCTLRSCNLFWRVWARQSQSANKQSSITNACLDELWRRCQDDDPVEHISTDAVLMLKLSPALRRAQHELEGRRSSTPGLSKGESDLSSTVSGDIFRNRRLSVQEEASGQAGEGRATSSGLQRVSPSVSTTSSRPQARRNTSGSKGRVPTIATVGRGRAKPALPRRKSSQSKHTRETVPKSPRTTQNNLAIPPLADKESDTASDISPKQGNRSAFELPSSWQDVEDSSSGAPSKANSMPKEPVGALVDPNFRMQFAERQKQLTSSTNLPAIGRMSKTGSRVRFSIDEPDERGKGKEVLPGVEDEIKEAYQTHGRKTSQAISDSDDSDAVELPRVHSSLSKMIKDHRRSRGSQDLGPPSPKVAQQERSSDSKKKEDELLKMARNAAKPVIPRSKTGGAHDSGYLSPDERTTF